jgi:hypothetical protein
MQAEMDEIGQANHVSKEGSVSTIIVKVFNPFSQNINGFIVLRSGQDDVVLIQSRNQWRQIAAFVEMGFSELEV